MDTIAYLRGKLHAALKDFERYGDDEYAKENVMLINAGLVQEVTKVFDSFQTPRKGHWAQKRPETRGNIFSCSECGNDVYYPQRKDSVRVPYTFCPYCRAYMETIFTDQFEPPKEEEQDD